MHEQEEPHPIPPAPGGDTAAEARVASEEQSALILALQGAFPALQARFGVQRLALGGLSSDEAVEPSVELIIELGDPLGLEWVELHEALATHCGRPVQLATFDTLEHVKQGPRGHIARRIEEKLHDVSLPA